MNEVLERKVPPPVEWLTSNIIPIPKKGDLRLATNYRGISLMSTSAKLYNKVLLNRLQPVLDPVLLPIQNGFRPSRGTVEQILAVRMIVDRCRTRQKSAVIVFVDFSKAFDSVNRKALAQILEMYGVPVKLRLAVMALYEGSNSRVQLSQSIHSDVFPTTTGVLQGDTLAPFLFVLVLDYVLRITFFSDRQAYDDAFDAGKKNGATNSLKIGGLAYADDIAIVTPSVDAAQRVLVRLADSAKKIGLVINVAKTQYMTIPHDTTGTQLSISGVAITQVEDFTYLGTNIADSQSAFHIRRGMSWAAAKSLQPIFNSNASVEVKVNLFRATVEQVLLYGCEALTITPSFSRVVDGTYARLLRYAIGIVWPKTMSTITLRDTTRCPRANQIIRSRRLRLIGHVLRAGGKQVVAALLQTSPTEKFRRGGHRRILYETILHQDLAMLQATMDMAQNRADWRELCARALTL
jgi:hypothetical protein